MDWSLLQKYAFLFGQIFLLYGLASIAVKFAYCIIFEKNMCMSY